MVVLEGEFCGARDYAWETFLFCPSLAVAGPFLLVGEERNEDPIVLASYQDFSFLHCAIGYGRGGDVALGWTCICLGREGLWEPSLALVVGLVR